MTLLEPHNLPFAVALGLLFVLALLQLVGAADLFEGAADVDMDFDADLDVDGVDGLASGGFIGALTSLFAFGKVPLLIWLAAYMLVFAAIGVAGQAIISNVMGEPLSAGFAALLAAIAAFPLNGLFVRPIGLLVPEDETSAVGIESLVRRDAVIQTGTARAGSPARSKVIDAHGHPHFVMVEPHDAHAELAEGETVLLVRREGQKFFAVRYESPLLTP